LVALLIGDLSTRGPATTMPTRTDLVLVPGLLCSPALWAPQIRALNDIAGSSVADHTRHASIKEIAEAILAAAPPRFALAGLSMGGYIAYEMIRQAADRVARLALLDTGAGAEAPERRAGRLRLIALAEQEGAVRAQQELLPLLIHTDRLRDKPLVDTVLQMASDTGVAAFKRQQMAIMARPDNRPLLSTIKCPTTRRCPHAAELGAGNCRRHPRRAARDHPELRPPLHLGTAGGCQSGAADVA
jgi:pimeloyl-ACP methyl ester carboxylesterase